MYKKNQLKLKKLLTKIKKEGVSNIINGKSLSAKSKKTFDNFSPVDEALICKVASSDDRDINMAAKAAEKAFANWRNTSHSKRKKLLYAIADLIDEHANEIALLESYDTGQAIRFTKEYAKRGANNFRFFADKIIDAPNGKSFPDTNHINFSIRQPIGPIGVITPWNVPFSLATWKIAPALAAGCTVVHKPAELSPLTANYLADLAHKAGIPKGVWNVVHGFGETTGKALTEHNAIKGIAFIGESGTGSQIMQQGAATLKRLHFKMSGKNPMIVFEDADLDRALDAAVYMKFSLNGERCTSSSRLFIHEKVYSIFIKKLKKRISNIKIGDPLNPATELGPMIHPRHQDKILDYVKTGKEEGATLLLGGRKPKGLKKGCYINPILFADVKSNMRIVKEEIFGPFLTVMKFKTEAEVLKKANASEYGLTAFIWTKDASRSLRMAKAVEAGMVWVNSQNVSHLPIPYGGMKNSGIGRDGGDYSFDFYMETKNISIALDNHPIGKIGI